MLEIKNKSWQAKLVLEHNQSNESERWLWFWVIDSLYKLWVHVTCNFDLWHFSLWCECNKTQGHCSLHFNTVRNY